MPDAPSIARAGCWDAEPWQDEGCDRLEVSAMIAAWGVSRVSPAWIDNIHLGSASQQKPALRVVTLQPEDLF